MSDELRDELAKLIARAAYNDQGLSIRDDLRIADAILPIIARESAAAWQTGHGDPECDVWVVEGMCAQYHPNPYRAKSIETGERK